MNCPGMLLWDPVIPPWLMALCLVLFAALAWRTYAQCNLSLSRRLVLFSLRLMAFIILCWLLMQPLERIRKTLDEKVPVLLVLDDSASMEDRPLGVTKSRAQRATEILQSREMKKIAEKHRLLPFKVAEKVTGGMEGERFAGGQSRLIANLKKVRKLTRGERPCAMILLTDGLDTSDLDLGSLVMELPCIIPELEDKTKVKKENRLEYAVDLPENKAVKRVIKGWKTSVTVTVNRLSGHGKDAVPVTLSSENQVMETNVVEFQEDSRYAQTTFELIPETLGNHAYQVKIRPKQDLERHNNQETFALEVTDEQNRVLYLEGLLRPEFKFFKRALQKERSFQATVYLRLGHGLFMNFDDGETAGKQLDKLLTTDNLKQFKVLVLGECKGDSFTPEQVKAVRKFVEQGGGLLLTGASRAYGNEGYLTPETFAPLSPALSQEGAAMAEQEDFPWNFSAAGRNDGVFMKLASEASFPPLKSLWQPVKLSEGAVKILETDQGQPVMVVRRYGEGRVCIYLSNTLYLLRLHGGGEGGISTYDRLVSQTIFWMLPDMKKTQTGDALQILLKEDGAEVNQRICVGALSRTGEKAENLHCEVTCPDGTLNSLPMQPTVLERQVGLAAPKQGFMSAFKATQNGTYALEIVRNDGQRTGQKLLVVRRPVVEMTGAPANQAFLRKLAELSHGRVIPYGQDDNLLEDIDIPERSRELIHEETLWDSWFWLVPLMALFCAEWYLRRRWDLV